MVIKQKHLIEFQIYYLLIVEALIDLFHFPAIIRYILDINVIVLILMAIPKVKDILNDKIFKRFNTYLIFYMAALAAFSLIRQTPFGQILWAIRNNYFYLLFFLISAYTLRPNDLKRIIKNVVNLQAFNVFCALYEYLILNKFGDFVGGMFGVSQGCNGSLNVYLAVITAYAYSEFASKKGSLLNVLLITSSSIVIAALSELKFYFFELIVIVILSITLSKPSAKNGMLVIATVLALFVGVQILAEVSPWSAELLRDFDGISEYSKSSLGDQIIARGTPFSQINEYFFRNDIFNNLFGYGFGACEDSETFSWANSSFATKYRDFQYRNISTAMNFIETGYVGLVAFIAIFVAIFIFAQIQKQKYEDILYIFVFTQIASVVAIMNIWYNSTIRRPIAYLTFFCLSAFIVYARDKMRREAREKAKKEIPKKSYFKSKNRKARNLI